MTTPHSPLTAHRRRNGFTLVELLIAMVLTLILITSIAQFYAIVGDSVKDGRAVIEMGGQMRAAVERLKADLDQITVALVPWTDDGAASGYFEYFEGAGCDYMPDGSTLITTSAQISTLASNGVTNTIGDGDDFLAFTIRTDGVPLNGRYTAPAGIITSQYALKAANTVPRIENSQLAEIIWWVGFDDGLGATANAWNFNEPRQLYRRQLIIRPDLGQLIVPGATVDYYPGTIAGWTQAQQDLMRFWQYNDISASIRAEFNGPDIVYRIRANSLSDLTRRENRFAHMPIQLVWNDTTTKQYLIDGATFPHSAVTQNAFSSVALLLPCFSSKSPSATMTNSYALQNGLDGSGPGEDIMLSNLLAFDVQVYDPYARLWADTGLTTAVTPSDPSYATLATGLPIGMGAFVDLNYYRYLGTNPSGTAMKAVDTNLFNTNGFPMPYFADMPTPPPYLTGAALTTYYNNFGYYNAGPYATSYGATYDTWSLNYERDGIDQSGNGTYDLQTNGLDDDNRNGVDDVNERDTVPPYSQPIRGLRVRIRLYEPSTRQVRQATVAADFINE